MSSPQTSYPEFYNSEEIQRILQLAINRQSQQGEISRSQLLEIASELDIEPTCLEQAEQEWLANKSLDSKRYQFNIYRREQLKYYLSRYVIINAFLVATNLITAGTLTWALYPLLFWGSSLTWRTWKNLQSQGKLYEEEFQRWYFRQEVKKSLDNFWFWFKKTWQVLTNT